MSDCPRGAIKLFTAYCKDDAVPLFSSVSVVSYQLRVISCQLSVTFCQLSVTFCQLSVTLCQFSVNFCQLSVTFRQLSVTFCQLSDTFVSCQLLLKDYIFHIIYVTYNFNPVSIKSLTML